MNKFVKFTVIGALAALLTACGARVEVPPAHVGKIMGKDGYRPGIIGTSKFRLDWCWAYCDKLVLINAGDAAKTENMDIFIPEDKLVLKVAVRTNLTLNKKGSDALFDALPPQASDDDDIAIIERDLAYNTYAQQIILTETREYLSQYSIAEIASSLEKVNSDLRIRLQKSLESRTPFSVRYVGITNIQYPAIITEAQENAAKRREMIEQENAQKEVDKVKLERQFQEAMLQRKIDVEKARADAESDRTRAAALTPSVIRLRELEIEKIKADNQRIFAEKFDGALPTYFSSNGGWSSLMNMDNLTRNGVSK